MHWKTFFLKANFCIKTIFLLSITYKNYYIYNTFFANYTNKVRIFFTILCTTNEVGNHHPKPFQHIIAAIDCNFNGCAANCEVMVLWDGGILPCLCSLPYSTIINLFVYNYVVCFYHSFIFLISLKSFSIILVLYLYQEGMFVCPICLLCTEQQLIQCPPV